MFIFGKLCHNLSIKSWKGFDSIAWHAKRITTYALTKTLFTISEHSSSRFSFKWQKWSKITLTTFASLLNLKTESREERKREKGTQKTKMALGVKRVI